MTTTVGVIMTVIVLPLVAIVGLSVIATTLVENTNKVWPYVIAAFGGATAGGLVAWLLLNGAADEGEVARSTAAVVLPFVPIVAIVVANITAIISILTNESIDLDTTERDN